MLHDDTIELRALEPEDLDVLYRWENDTELWKVGSSIAPFSRKILWDYIENYSPDIYAARQLRLMVVLRATGRAIGTVDFYDFDPHNKRAGVGMLIDSAEAGRGYGTRALTLATSYARGFLGMHQLWAVIPVDNKASMALFKKCGYRCSGRMRSWLRLDGCYHDALIMQHLAAPVN